MPGVEQREGRPRHALKQCAVGFRTREDANAEQHGKQQAGEIRGATIRRNRSVRLASLDRSTEEHLDFTETVGD